MSEKLRECPFCGELPELNMMNVYGKTGSSIKYSYTCSNCGLLMIEWDKEKLIKSWNTRHQPKHETVQQWEERTGERYRSDSPVYVRIPVDITLNAHDYILMDNRQASIDGYKEEQVFIANHHGKPS